MRSKTRVVHVITRLDLGGAQEIAIACVRRLDPLRYDATLIAGAGGLLDEDAKRSSGFDVRIVPWLVHPIDPLADLHALRCLTRVFDEIRPDIVHAHSSKAGVLVRLAAVAARVPVVVFTAHGWSFNDTQRPLVRATYGAVERVLATTTDRIYTVSERDRERGIERGIRPREPIAVLHAGIDVAQWAHACAKRDEGRRVLGCSDDDIVVGTIGNLKPQKSPLDLVDAAALALREEPRLSFVVAGDGELREAVQERIRFHGIGARFRLLGWRRDPERILAALDIFLLLSRFEGLPRSVLEAFAVGVPVVATAIDGIPEVVEDGRTGSLVAAGDVAGAARAIVALAHAPERRREFATHARARLVDDFDLAKMITRLERDYDALLRSHGRA
jgi:glycosyltransferase involved in cell wall biosynthesis